MRRLVLALVLLALPVPALARVLCTRRSGMIAARDVCRPSETPVDAQMFGLVGPPGPAGAPGPSGPPGPFSSGIVCNTRCVSGTPAATFTCGGQETTCPSPDGVQAVHATYVDCTSSGLLAVPFCAATTCAPGPCAEEIAGYGGAARDVAKAAAGQDVYVVEHDGQYAVDCRILPGFTPSSGTTCSTAPKVCAGGYQGYTVVTAGYVSGPSGPLLTVCIWDSCPPNGVRGSCSIYPG
jgi:hypothetical protein